jgi:thiamine biosynthesis lipoprotein
LSRLNQQAHQSPIKISEPLFEVLQQSVTLSRETNGAFDVTVGPLVDLFRSAEKKGAAPTEEEIAKAKLKTGFQKLKLDEQNRTAKFTVEDMRLDLGGIAKGYAIDKAVEAMQKGGAIGGMVDVGGDIRCFGAPPQGKNKWLIGLQDPSVSPDTVIPAQAGIGTGKTLLVLKLTNAAIATSGDYRRFTLLDGKKYSHIIDTQTGYSSEGLASVTIITRHAVDADVLATAVSVMGAEKGLALIETKPETEAILISPPPDYEIAKSSGAESFID